MALSTVTLGSEIELQTYNEVRAVVVRAVHMTWDFLIRFPEKDHPERQSVNLSIARELDDMPEHYLTSYEVDDSEIAFEYMAGQFAIRIDHTARTFGADIEALFSGHIRSLIRPPHPIVARLRRVGGKIEQFLLAATVISLSVLVMLSAHRHAAALHRALDQLAAAQNAGASQRTDVMLERTYAGDWQRLGINAFCISAVTLVIVWYLGSRAWRHILAARPSVFMLTPKSAEFRDRLLRRYNRGWIWFLLSCFLAVALNVVASYLFAWLYPAT